MLLLPIEVWAYFRSIGSDGKVLTSWNVVPVGSIDDVVVSEEVPVVARPPVWVRHHLVKRRRDTFYTQSFTSDESLLREQTRKQIKVSTWLVLAYAVANQRKKLSSGVGVCARGAQSRVMSNG